MDFNGQAMPNSINGSTGSLSNIRLRNMLDSSNPLGQIRRKWKRLARESSEGPPIQVPYGRKRANDMATAGDGDSDVESSVRKKG